MDPNECLAELVEAARDGDSDKVLSRAAALAGWLDGGGFRPIVSDRTIREIRG